MPNDIASETAEVALKARERKKRSGSIGAGAWRSQKPNSDQQGGAGEVGADHGRAAPPERVALHRRVDDAEQAGARQPDAREVEPAGGAVALDQAAARDRQQREADGHVDPEDPLPRDALDDRAAGERAHRDGEAADARPDAEREAALLGRERLAEQRQRERGDDRAAEALDRPRGDQRVGRGRERGGGRGGGEDPDPDQEHAAAAEAVAERGAREQEDGERERVAVDGPLEVLERGAEVAADARQRRRDDEVVERDHEDRDGGDREGDETAS